MTRDQALNLIQSTVQNKNIIKHMLATEAVMKTLAEKLAPDNVDDWGLAGVLHDGDYSDDVPIQEQGIKISKLAEEKGYQLSEEIKHAMAAHNAENTGVEPISKMDWALFCCDSLTGLIVAATLVLPSKKLADLTVESVLKRFKEPSFAKGTRREDIKMCNEKLGIPLEEFVKISLGTMQKIASKLGL